MKNETTTPDYTYTLLIKGRYNTSERDIDYKNMTEREIREEAASFAYGFHCDFDSVVLEERLYNDEYDSDYDPKDEEYEVIRTTGNILYTGINCHDDSIVLDEDSGEYWDNDNFGSYEEAKKANKTYDTIEGVLRDQTIEDPSGCALDWV